MELTFRMKRGKPQVFTPLSNRCFGCYYLFINTFLPDYLRSNYAQSKAERQNKEPGIITKIQIVNAEIFDSKYDDSNKASNAINYCFSFFNEFGKLFSM